MLPLRKICYLRVSFNFPVSVGEAIKYIGSTSLFTGGVEVHVHVDSSLID